MSPLGPTAHPSLRTGLHLWMVPSRGEIGVKHRDLGVCGDNWSGASSVAAAQKLLRTGQHDLEVDWNVAPKQVSW